MELHAKEKNTSTSKKMPTFPLAQGHKALRGPF